jgi:predicted DNA-binding transcriptional regulator AlpA
MSAESMMMMTVEHAAIAADTSVNTIWRAVRTGKLPRYKRGPRDTRFLSADVEAFKLARHQRRADRAVG